MKIGEKATEKCSAMFVHFAPLVSIQAAARTISISTAVLGAARTKFDMSGQHTVHVPISEFEGAAGIYIYVEQQVSRWERGMENN